MFEANSDLAVRSADSLFFRVPLVVSSKEDRPEESSVNGTLIHHDGVLLVVARVTSNSHDTIATRWQLFEVQVLHRLGLDKWLLGIVKHMRQGIHSDLIVRSVHSHSLLTHCRLVSVSGRLVVVWERNDRGADTENHRRMNLEMSIVISLLLPVFIDVVNKHGNHRRLFLFNIKQLHKAVSEELLKVPFFAHDFGDVFLP